MTLSRMSRDSMRFSQALDEIDYAFSLNGSTRTHSITQFLRERFRNKELVLVACYGIRNLILMQASLYLIITRKNSLENADNIIVVGGGFGGVRATLDLAKRLPDDTKIILISDKPYFEYQPSLYRIATSSPPFGVVVPLKDLFSKKRVEVIHDSIIGANLHEKILSGKSGEKYHFKSLVIALGSEVNYHGIATIRDLTFSLKSAVDALRLNHHLKASSYAVKDEQGSKKISLGHIVIVGGGSTGTELAGELAIYMQELSRKYGFDPSYITIDIIDSGRRLLKHLPVEISERVERRLRNLGVNVFLNRKIVGEHIKEIYLKDMHLKTNTVIWSAGVSPNRIYSEIEGLSFSENKRVLVDEFLQAKGQPDIFIIGDGAEAPYWGFAQTALHQGRYVAELITNKTVGKKTAPYKPRKPSVAVPVGIGWAAVLFGPFKFYGRFGWWLRRLGNLRFFLSIFPFQKALEIARSKVGLNSVEGLEKYLETSPLPEEIRIQTKDDVTLPKKF